MTTISPRANLVTLVNVFAVEPDKQQALVDLLNRATDETIRHLPGFISANIHRSLDGVRVTNYAQWRSREDFEAMLHNPAAAPHFKDAAALAISVDPHLYDVVAVRNVRNLRNGGDAAAAVTAIATRAAASGAVAIGACAIGALALGRLAIGYLAMRRARIETLAIENVIIGRLGVRDLIVD
jgi:quinol monooxygenase YgiN